VQDGGPGGIGGRLRSSSSIPVRANRIRGQRCVTICAEELPKVVWGVEL
jgi:hypothetical protein